MGPCGDTRSLQAYLAHLKPSLTLTLTLTLTLNLTLTLTPTLTFTLTNRVESLEAVVTSGDRLRGSAKAQKSAPVRGSPTASF